MLKYRKYIIMYIIVFFTTLTLIINSILDETLPYPKSVFGAEFLLLIILSGLEWVRLFFG